MLLVACAVIDIIFILNACLFCIFEFKPDYFDKCMNIIYECIIAK